MLNISIIISYSGKQSHLDKCIGMLIPQLLGGDEIIVVDDSQNGIQGGVTAFIRTIPNDEYDKSHNNLVYCRNLGAKSSKNDILVFLDEDIYASKDLVSTYRRFVPINGIVCGKIEWQKGDVLMEDFRIDTDAEIVKFNNIARVGIGGGGNFAVLKSIFDDVGGFSMEYNGRWGHEDIDLFRKIQALNKDIYYSPLASAVHMEHRRDLKGNSENHEIFKEKWAL